MVKAGLGKNALRATPAEADLSVLRPRDQRPPLRRALASTFAFFVRNAATLCADSRSCRSSSSDSARPFENRDRLANGRPVLQAERLRGAARPEFGSSPASSWSVRRAPLTTPGLSRERAPARRAPSRGTPGSRPPGPAAAARASGGSETARSPDTRPPARGSRGRAQRPPPRPPTRGGGRAIARSSPASASSWACAAASARFNSATRPGSSAAPGRRTRHPDG